MIEKIKDFIERNINLKAYSGYKYIVCSLKNDGFIQIIFTRYQPILKDESWFIDGKYIVFQTDIEYCIKDEDYLKKLCLNRFQLINEFDENVQNMEDEIG